MMGATFVCWATIVEIDVEKYWYYISCPRCSRKLKKNGKILICKSCRDPQPAGIIRYQIEVQVRDATDTTTFVLFYSHVAQLTGWTAADLLNAVGGPQTKVAIPQVLLHTIDQTFKFQVKLTDYNFQAAHNAIRVSCILDQLHVDVGNP